MNIKLLLTISVLAVFGLASLAEANVMYSHPFAADRVAYKSQFDPGQSITYRGFADYYWDGSFTITDFHWWGISDFDDNSTVGGFVFQIYGNDSATDRPGDLLYQ